jgi:hypothetical protein
LNNYCLYLLLMYQIFNYCLFVEVRRLIRNYLTIDFNYTGASSRHENKVPFAMQIGICHSGWMTQFERLNSQPLNALAFIDPVTRKAFDFKAQPDQVTF